MLENQIRREDLGYRLMKALEIKGQGTPTFQLDSTMVPVVLVEDLSRGNEQDFQVNRWARGTGLSGVGGVAFGKLSFNNHVDSGLLVKVYQIDLYHLAVIRSTGAPLLHPSGLYAGGEIGITLEASSTGGTQITFTKQFIDGRLDIGTIGRLPSVDIRNDNSGGIGSHFARPFVTPVGYHLNLGGMVLNPGTRLHFEALDGDIQYRASVEWTETNL